MIDQKWVQVNKSEHKVYTIYFNTEWFTYLRAKAHTKLEMGDLLHLGMGRC